MHLQETHRPGSADLDAARVLFDLSFLPMLIADDSRRYVDANRAATLLLRLPYRQVLRLRIDDLTPPEQLVDMHALWSQFIATGTLAGRFLMRMPDGQRISLQYSATANFTPGRHLSILDLAGTSAHERAAPAHDGDKHLSGRERQILVLVAMGETTDAIAHRLAISSATVDTHLRRAMAKLGARNRPHAIALAFSRGELILG